jgi:serine/threonine protein phosphatase PrpC
MLWSPSNFWADVWTSLERRQREWTGTLAWSEQTGEPGVEATIRRRRPAPRLSICSAAETHSGVVRELNEDAVLDRGQIGLWAVADGVGGADAGELASEAVVDALSRLSPADAAGQLHDQAADALQGANRQLCREAVERGSSRGIAATVVCLVIHDARFSCLWAGDSRLYRLRAGRFEQLSRDHTEVQALLDYGLLTAEEAKHHPRSNTITRAVGAGDELQLDQVEGEVEPDDCFLLCSDGLTKVVDDDEIALILAQMEPTRAVHRLIRMTLERGAPDNVSVVAVQAAATDY